MLPYRYYAYPVASAAGLIPDYYPCTVHPPYRYLFLHLLYSPLQDNLRTPFHAVSMLPYRYFLKCYPAPSVSALNPIIIHARTLD